ncbi:hypothetical protein GCM10010394_56730 [Streptomyces crystallinus]|uniref:Uncharacterized protein n=1 Tax=Streptomyces crystallinus TaxID=68191 RepID=A0ABP3RWH8_9ACTN
MPLAYGFLKISGADAAGHGGCGGVGEEDEDAHGGGEEGRRDAQAGQLRGAEVADDRTVGHDEERLGDQSAEGGDGERDDLAVVSAPGVPRCHWGLCHELNLIFHR